ncbi:putative N-acetylmannosamine-6-phosphate epimerase [Bradyrhizobium sp. S3.9.2]
MDETWRVVLAIGATAIVVGGAFLAIRFIIGLHL